MGTQHHARRPSRALGSSRLSVASGLACVGLGDRCHSMVGGQVESVAVLVGQAVVLDVVSVGQVVVCGRPGQCRFSCSAW